nr:uncharacterized protein LOC125990304 isoform X18 [Syngnathus scovelli]
MLRFKASTCIFTAQGATLQNEPQVCICDRRPRLTAKRFQNGRPACSPESPDFMRRLQANELRLERRSELFLPAFFIGETPVHSHVNNCLTNLFQRVHSLPVLSTRWSQRTWYQSAAWIEVKAPGGAGPGSQKTRSHDLPVLAVQLPVRVLQRPSTCWAKKFSKTMPKVSVQERIISRAWPDVSHKKRLQQKAEVANPGPESGKTCQFASIL